MDQTTLEYLGNRVDEARKIQAAIDQSREAIKLAEAGEFFVLRRVGSHFACHVAIDGLREEVNHTIQSLLIVRVMQLESFLLTI